MALPPDYMLIGPLAKKIFDKMMEDSFKNLSRSLQTSQVQQGQKSTLSIKDMPRHCFPFESRGRFDPMDWLNQPFPQVRAEAKPPCTEPDPNGLVDMRYVLSDYSPLGLCCNCERPVWPVEVLKLSGVGYTLMEYLKHKNPRGFHEGDFPKGWPEGKEINWEIE